FLGVATLVRGWALAQQGQTHEGITEILRAFDVYRTTGSGINWPQVLIPLAEVHGRLRQVARALTAIEAALPAIEKTGARRDEAEPHRLRGVMTLRRKTSRLKMDTAVEAEQYFRKAIEGARNQGAKTWELRAATRLARHRPQTNRSDEARAFHA